jgi:biopolymer transport protein TolR
MKPGNFSSSGRPATLAEINVTPLVDVMLVLLIIFMICTPLMQQGIQVDLPKANTGTLTQSDEPDNQLVISLDRHKKILIAEHVIQPGTLFRKLEAISAAKPGIEVAIQADQDLPYGFIAQVMAEVKKAGIHKVGLVTLPEETTQRL